MPTDSGHRDRGLRLSVVTDHPRTMDQFNGQQEIINHFEVSHYAGPYSVRIRGIGGADRPRCAGRGAHTSQTAYPEDERRSEWAPAGRPIEAPPVPQSG